MSRWFSASTSERLADLAGGLVSTDVLSSGPLAACTGLALSDAAGLLSVVDSVVCANIIAGMETAIETATTAMWVQAVSNRIILPSYSTSRSCSLPIRFAHSLTPFKGSSHETKKLARQGQSEWPIVANNGLPAACAAGTYDGTGRYVVGRIRDDYAAKLTEK